MDKTVIFDVDGTLLDGTEGILSSVQYMIQKHNLANLLDDTLLTFVGPPIQDSLKRIYNMDDSQAQLCANTFRNKYKNEDVYKAKVYDGIYDLLDLLKTKGCKIGVATYKREDYAINLMKYFCFDKYFNSICGADNENKLKKIDIMKNCIDSLTSDNKNAIMIGDSWHDAEAAQKLKVDFIGVTYGFGFRTKEDVMKYNSILSANSVSEIINFFQEEDM